jgi:YHS domain-containing protein
MSSPNYLYLRLEELVREADARRAARQRERRSEMERQAAKRARFEAMARQLVAGVLRPRLEMLVRLFDHAQPVEELRDGHGLAVTFPRTEEFAAHARVEVGIAHDPDFGGVWCTFSPSIIPILMEYERERSLELDLEAPDRSMLEAFLDERLERFVAAYLRVREPDSLYQKDHRVRDPVCGMSFRRADAHSVLEFEGRRVYFCEETCRRLFEAAPDLYVAGARRAGECVAT